MSEINDTATVTLNVNGAQAKRMMSELETNIEQTNAKISSLKANIADPKEIHCRMKYFLYICDANTNECVSLPLSLGLIISLRSATKPTSKKKTALADGY